MQAFIADNNSIVTRAWRNPPNKINPTARWRVLKIAVFFTDIKSGNAYYMNLLPITNIDIPLIVRVDFFTVRLPL